MLTIGFPELRHVLGWIIFIPPFETNKKHALLGGHHVLLAHFRAVRLYRSMKLGGKIGAVNCLTAISPADMCREDLKAVELQWEQFFGWWTQPMLEGTYPQLLIRELPYIRDNMPPHYQQELDKWFAPMDFIGVNYYIASRTQYNPQMELHSKAVQSFYSAPGQRFAPYPAGLFDVVMSIAAEIHSDLPLHLNMRWRLSAKKLM